MTPIRHLCRYLLCGLLLLSHWVWADSFTAQVDRQAISLSQTFNLQVVYEGRTHEEPDFSRLEEHFEIVSQAASRQVRVDNGNASSSMKWNLTLAPKQAGQLLIPPLSLDGQQTQPITITVSSAEPSVHTTDQDVFIETHISASSAYVQEQVILTYRVYYAVNLSRLEPKLFQLDNLRTQELPRNDFSERRGHRQYEVVEFKVAVSSDVSGTLTLPSLQWTAQTDDPASRLMGFSSGRQNIIRLVTDEKTLTIKPKPANYPAGAPWLPARNLSLSQTWSQATDKLVQGEPVTRRITLQAEGVNAEQLPPISEKLPTEPGIKIYPDKPELDTQTTASGTSATRIESLSLLPNQAGQLTTAPITVYWWDTQQDQLRQAELPAQPLQVSPANQAGSGTGLPQLPETPAAASTTSNASSPSSATLPVWVMVLLGLLVLSNLLLLFLYWRKPTGVPSSATSISPSRSQDPWPQLLAACKSHSAKATRESLLLWASHRSGNSFTRLTEVADWLQDAELSEALGQLDQALYSTQAQSWNGDPLAQRLAAWQAAQKKHLNAEDEGLAPLYD
jgi:hypothetical protein